MTFERMLKAMQRLLQGHRKRDECDEPAHYGHRVNFFARAKRKDLWVVVVVMGMVLFNVLHVVTEVEDL